MYIIGCRNVAYVCPNAVGKHRSQHQLQQAETTNQLQEGLAIPQAAQQAQQDSSMTTPQLDTVQLLERSYQQASVPNSTQQRRVKRAPAASSSTLRPLVIRSALPVFRTIRFTERRLEADLMTIAATVMLVVGFIIWDRGVEELLDGLLGDGPKGSVFCIVVGLGIVVAVRLSGFKTTRIFSP
jgi:hypothetical protein